MSGKGRFAKSVSRVAESICRGGAVEKMPVPFTFTRVSVILYCLFAHVRNALRVRSCKGFFRVLGSLRFLYGSMSQSNRLLFNFDEHARLMKILSAARKNGVLSHDPYTDHKYLGEYLALFMNTANRRKALLFHYSFFLGKRLNRDFTAKIMNGVIIWKNEFRGGGIHICLEQSDRMVMEGELSLVFFHDSKRLYTITFSVCRGNCLGLPHNAVLFIGGVQGQKGRSGEIRRATKFNHEISPVTMLVIAAQAIGAVLKLNAIVGVTSRWQCSSRHHEYVQNRKSSYDNLWAVFGGIPHADKVFVLPIEGKDLPIMGKNRARTRRKRAMKKIIRDNLIRGLEKEIIR